MKYIYSLILLLGSLRGFAQSNDSTIQAGLESTIGFNIRGSSNLPLILYFKGGYWNDQQKNNYLRNINSTISGGFQWNNSIKIKINSSKLYIHLEHHNYAGFSLNKNLIDLYIFGNARHAGKDLNLEKTAYSQWTWSGVGLEKRFHHSTLGDFDMIGAVGPVFTYQSLNIQQSNIYTEIGGRHIDFSSNGNWQRQVSNQIGIPIGYHASAGIKWIKVRKINKFESEIQNMGIARIHKMQQASWDTSFRFFGISPDFSRLLDQNYTDGFADSVSKTFSLAFIDRITWRMLPFNSWFTWTHEFNKQSSFIMGIRYLYMTGYIPEIYVGSKNRIKNYFIETGVSAGGWGDFDIVTRCGVQHKKWSLSIDVRSLEGLFLPRVFSGGAIGFRFLFLKP